MTTICRPQIDISLPLLCRDCLADLLYAALSDSICCLELYMQALGQAGRENRSAESLHPSLVHVPSFENPLTLCVCPLINPPLTRVYARKPMTTGVRS
jgi:hypothetical protein